MTPVLADTSVYIAAFRSGDPSILNLREAIPDAVVWLSAVVLEELYAGATSSSIHLVERLERDFGGVNRTLVPNSSDWVQTGRLLAKFTTHFDYEATGRARLTNDTLIAMSAGRMGITVVTKNVKDFARLAELRQFSWIKV